MTEAGAGMRLWPRPDDHRPDYDVALAVQKIVDADVATTFAAARELDFLRVRTPLLDTAMCLRGLPDRLRHRTAPPLAKLTLADGAGLPGWLSLGARQDNELAFGAVGKFWQANIERRDVPLAEFRDFREPGWGKIA
jgi:hypothetical protein